MDILKIVTVIIVVFACEGVFSLTILQEIFYMLSRDVKTIPPPNLTKENPLEEIGHNIFEGSTKAIEHEVVNEPDEENNYEKQKRPENGNVFKESRVGNNASYRKLPSFNFPKLNSLGNMIQGIPNKIGTHLNRTSMLAPTNEGDECKEEKRVKQKEEDNKPEDRILHDKQKALEEENAKEKKIWTNRKLPSFGFPKRKPLGRFIEGVSKIIPQLDRTTTLTPPNEGKEIEEKELEQKNNNVEKKKPKAEQESEKEERKETKQVPRQEMEAEEQKKLAKPKIPPFSIPILDRPGRIVQSVSKIIFDQKQKEKSSKDNEPKEEKKKPKEKNEAENEREPEVKNKFKKGQLSLSKLNLLGHIIQGVSKLLWQRIQMTAPSNDVGKSVENDESEKKRKRDEEKKHDEETELQEKSEVKKGKRKLSSIRLLKIPGSNFDIYNRQGTRKIILPYIPIFSKLLKMFLALCSTIGYISEEFVSLYLYFYDMHNKAIYEI